MSNATQSKHQQQADLYTLLKRPVVTEKATALSAYNQYVFLVDKTANKLELAKAFELAFPGRKVKAVRLIKVPAYKKRMGKSVGTVNEQRKAVFTIEGEPLEFFNA
ncbi:MAG: 50S ribosomal protein L23 [Vampirovibrionales bacterium]|nr:50S ribosomal protein L23 [Vampirovibrionales bacterium]